MEFLKDAVDLDPAAAFAYTGLAQGYMKLGHTLTADVDENETFNKAKAAAKKALSLDEGQAEAYAVLAEVSMYLDWDYKAAEEAFKNAILVKPSMVDVHAHYAWLHVIYDRWDDAVYEAKLTMELDPFSTVYTSWLAWVYWWAGRPDDAIEIAGKTIEMNSDYSVGHMVLGSALADKGMYSEAIPSLEKAVELFPGWASHLVRALWQSGNIEEAQRVFEEYKDDPRLKSRDLAPLYAGIENREGTIKYLNKMIEDRDQLSPWIYSIPFYLYLHDDPEFLDICRRANVPEEVINSGKKNILQRTTMVY
jgi:tetratricopeptide (TPR) repeat protein